MAKTLALFTMAICFTDALIAFTEWQHMGDMRLSWSGNSIIAGIAMGRLLWKH